MLLRRDSSPGLRVLMHCGFGVLFVAAIVLRVKLYPIVTSDYTAFLSPWYDYIQTHGGFAAMKDNFSNYNMPYLYLMAVLTYLPITKLVAIKSLSVVFDIVLGLFTYLLIGLKYRRSYAALAGALVVLFAPTIFINSSAWGQCDAIYTAFCLGSLYFLLKERPAWACIFFGLAISFKLQAIFFLPVLLVLALKKKLPLQYLAIIPLIFVLLLVPAFIAGRDAWSLLTIYVGQATTGGVGNTGHQFNGGAGGQFNGGQFSRGNNGQFNGGGNGQFRGRGTGQPGGGGQPGGRGQFNRGGNGQFNGGGQGNQNFSPRSRQNTAFTSSSLTLNAPSFYQWLPANAPGIWKWVGIILAGLMVCAVGILCLVSKVKLSSEMILKMALVFAVAIPFLLPEMHERYFFLADVLSITYAFYFPRYFLIPILMQLSSLLSYAPYLQRTQIVGLQYVAVIVLVIVVITFTDLVKTLFPYLDMPEQATGTASIEENNAAAIP